MLLLHVYCTRGRGGDVARRSRRALRRGFGAIRRLPSGRVQASYIGPDLKRYIAPHTFEAAVDAEAWLGAERHLLTMTPEEWVPPKQRRSKSAGGVTLAEYAPGAVERRRVKGEPLRPRTRALYLSLLDRVILPEFGHQTLRQITPAAVADWYESLPRTKPTQRAHAYSLLRTVLGQAVEEGHLSDNPCKVRGAGKSSRARDINIATPAQLVAIADGMPPHLRLLVMLAAWCGLRYGELAELRRHDVDVEGGVLRVRRAVVRVDGRDLVGPTKSEAGTRNVAVPPHLLPAVAEHLSAHVGRRADALLFPRKPGDPRHLMHTELTKIYAQARAAAGRPDLRLHDLRHTGATYAAQTGATLAELMARLEHSTTGAALRYQHAAAGRDAQIAARLSELAGHAGTGDTRAN